jgi:Tfp pilus assembly protein PilO
MLVAGKKQIVMSIAVIALAIAFVFFQFMPLNRKASSLKAANVNLIAESASAAAKQKALPQLCGEIKQIEERMGNFDAKIPVGRSHGSFLQKLTSVMQQQGLIELMVQPGIETQTLELSCIPVNVRCKGELIQIFKFFGALEKFERVIQIEEVLLNCSDKLDGVTMQAKMNIFYRSSDGFAPTSRTE